MSISRKFNPKLLAASLALAMLLIVTFTATGNYNNKSFFYNSLTAYQDTVPRSPIRRDTTQHSIDSLSKKDSSSRKDTLPSTKVDTLDLKISKDSIDAPIEYSASDSVVLEVPEKRITLYNKGNVKQKDLDLSAYKIELDHPKKLVI